MYISKAVANGYLQQVKRHNSEEAKARQLAEVEKEEAKIKRLYDLIISRYGEVKHNQNTVLASYPYKGGKIEISLKIGTNGRVILYAYGIGYSKPITSENLICGYVGEQLPTGLTIDKIRVWRLRFAEQLARI